MKYSFDRVPMAIRSRSRIRPALTALVVTATLWHAAAVAQDILERSVSFHIAPSPLSSALIEFSAQSGLQVAAADADVSQLNSNGVNGTFSARAALDLLLDGTSLKFSRIGATTVVINPLSGPAKVAPARIDGSLAAARMQKSNAQPSPEAPPGPVDIPDVTVTAARPPTDEELTGDSLSQFVAHHATVHYFNTGVTGNLARWRGGKQSICPIVMGLNTEQDAYVAARVRALATYVGAPVQADTQCRNNVQIMFTGNPEQNMDAVVKWATVYFRNRYRGGTKDLIAFRSDHAIQGWYMTTRGGDVVLNTDVEFVGLDVLPVWPQITQRYAGRGAAGSGSAIGVVILVVDTTKIVGYSIGAIADYLAMLTLSVAQSPDHCDPLPSILDLMSSNCGKREAPTAMTAGDLAFLRALYYKNTGLGRSLTRSQIQDNMVRQFNSR